MRPSNSEDPDDLEAIPSSTEDNSLDFARLSDGADEPFPEAVDSEEEAGPNFEASVVKIDDDFFGDEEEPLFSPPLYVQRYCAVERIIDGFAQTSCIKSLADLGCAELKFIVRAKNGKQFQRIIGVDRDEFLVGSHCRRIQPGVFEMINKRDQPLTIEVYAGDATEPDQRLLDVDVVTAIELIEHMEPEIHAALAAAVFGVMQPQLAIFTTPNVEYNPLFPGGSVDLRRHWDHRFEWTRAEFQAWAHAITDKYPAYIVHFQGVGYGPADTLETHGCCSQIAVFTRNSAILKTKPYVTSTPYKLIRQVDYPWAPPKTLAEELFSILDGECYSLAKELQDEEEQKGLYNRQWFTFTVEQLFSSRWRLQDLVGTPANLEMIRTAIRVLHKEWVRFDEENDQVSYQLLLHSDSDGHDESSLMDPCNGDVDAGSYPMDPETELMLELMEDPPELV